MTSNWACFRLPEVAADEIPQLPSQGNPESGQATLDCPIGKMIIGALGKASFRLVFPSSAEAQMLAIVATLYTCAPLRTALATRLCHMQGPLRCIQEGLTDSPPILSRPTLTPTIGATLFRGGRPVRRKARHAKHSCGPPTGAYGRGDMLAPAALPETGHQHLGGGGIVEMPSTEFSVAAGRAVWSPCWVALGCLPGEYLVSAEYRAWGGRESRQRRTPFFLSDYSQICLEGRGGSSGVGGHDRFSLVPSQAERGCPQGGSSQLVA
ncbi:hypothetical protein PoMZ_11920 [Pyricularia oryzae]|uniref:Uncharacterized protein n=1 Tax=Pyricularia oryzae TaxID=318829 RepID=A0A4P7NLU5_PYROR|nr:hypothetical protein PoMZ_11920 [Pyricularia oryzae]